MEDPNVPFADTTARRAELLKATERFKSSIETGVQSIQGDAKEIGKTAAIVAGVALAVFIVADAILPKSDEYRYAEKYGEPDDDDYDEYDEQGSDAFKSNRQLIHETKKEQTKKSALGGLVGGLVTSVLTSIARQQLSDFVARIRENNAANRPASTSSDSYQPQQPATRSNVPASYSEQL